MLQKVTNKNEIEVYTYKPLESIRIKGDPNNPLFCLVDVCKILDFSNAQNAIKSLNEEFGDGVKFLYPIIDSLGRVQKANFINEKHLYFLIMRSRKPEAKDFRLWITKEILPAIRKKGNYTNSQNQSASSTPTISHKDALKKIIELAQSNIALLESNEKLEFQNNEKQERLNIYSDIESLRRNKAKLKAHFNNCVRKLANVKFKNYGDAYNFVYKEFARSHNFYDTEINIDFISKNIDYLQECLEITLHELNTIEINKFLNS